MPADPLVRRAQPWLGTIVEIAVPSACASLIDDGFQKIADVHRAMSFHSESSDLARLRSARPGDLVEISAHTVKVLRAAERLHEISDGQFDVTIAAQLVEWGFLPCPKGWPLEATGAAATDIEIVDDVHVRLRKPLLIDLGGIAKGYAVDLAVDFLEDGGVETGLVNAGGDLRVFGDMDFPIALRAADWSGVAEQLTLRDGAVATSSNNAHGNVAGGHARTPHVNKMRKAALFNGSVSVFAPFAVYADALTKIAICDSELAATLAPEFGAEIYHSSVM